NKPDGICVIKPGQGAQFVAGLPVRRFHGVGPRGAEKMAKLGIATGADLAAKDIAWLRANFGSFADYLYRAARAIDLRPVRANRIRKSLGGERTFNDDISSGPALRAALDDIIEIVWERIAEHDTRGRTVTLKLKFTDFQLMTRAKSLPRAIDGKAEFARLSREILDEALPLPMPVRLMGLTLSNLEGEEGDERPPDTAQLSLL
ncbi:MAG: DinB/UmuC family translesion DNA polymerase, partial [Croceibacterium sp.]